MTIKHLAVLFFTLIFITIPIVSQNSAPILSIIGEEEIVFDWTTDRCEDNDIPDLPARAFQDNNGNVQLIAAHYDIYRSIGETLDTVIRDCNPVMLSDYQIDPMLHQGNQWISGLYTEDGETIYTIFHNEYHNIDQNSDFADWYNVLTAGISIDSGASYQLLRTAPNHFVAGLPYQYEAGAGPYGILESSNIIKGVDNYYYFFTRIDEYRSNNQWICLLRTDTLTNPDSWRAWDGTQFSIEFFDPYQQTIDNPRQNLCAPIATRQIGVMNQSITYNSYLNRYVLVSISADTINGREIWGIYYAFSDDLIHWTRRQLLLETELPWTYEFGDANPILYPTLIDNDSDTRNFETTDNTTYLYFTRMNYQNGQQTLDRDLIRVPVQFFRSQADADAPERTTNLSLFINEGLATGQFTDSNNNPIAEADLQVIALPDNDDRLYERRGTIPDNATNALVGWRVNTECDCNGVAEMTIYLAEFTIAEQAINLVPYGSFDNGSIGWDARGDRINFIVGYTDNFMELNIDETDFASVNSYLFNVTAGDSYRLRFDAIISEDTRNSGYFAVIFTDESGEIQRDRITFRPNTNDLGIVTTDANGQYAISLGSSSMSTIEARFEGNELYNPIKTQFSQP
ncbi:MAG: hypothetical protein WBC91_24275 [Phototrophicaceae bacterium]